MGSIPTPGTQLPYRVTFNLRFATIPSMSAERNLEKPVVLSLGYAEWPRRQGQPDVYSSLQVLAAGELLRQSKIEAVVFTTGSLKKGGSTIAQAMTNELNINTREHYKDSVINAPPKETSTRAEIRQFEKIAQERGWNNLMVIGKNAHLKRIRRAIKRTFRNRGDEIPVKSTEDVLMTEAPVYAPNRYRDIIRKVHASAQDQGFKRREKIISLVDSIPLIGGQLLDLLNKILANKNLEMWTAKVLSRK